MALYTVKEAQFYEIMDIVDQYDSALTKLNQKFNQAMLDLANIKFLNPNSSIHSAGFKPTPALMLYNKQQNKIFLAESGEYIKKVGDENEFLQEQQAMIEQNVKQLISRNDLTETQKIISRFGSYMNQKQIQIASQKFRQYLDFVLEIGSKKKEAIKKLQEIQDKLKLDSRPQ